MADDDGFVPICMVCGREGHARCGKELWMESRAKWRQRSLHADRQEDDASHPVPQEQAEDDAAADRPERKCPSLPSRASSASGSSGKTNTLDALSQADRLNLRSCLASTSLPYPPLRRRIPLKLAVDCAVQLWGADGSLISEQESPVVRLAQAAKESTQDFLFKTSALGSSFVSWGQGIFGSASQAIDISPCQPREERKENPLLESLRNRGGIQRASSKKDAHETIMVAEGEVGEGAEEDAIAASAGISMNRT
eukprot:TRINITY_DN29802_c0_g1_i3.p1 TRINITY_DN29802_c0_g1~~TRINITY_DN29802_c0_g1_i3.p1  ORF type:complete len:253 (-),score=58.88 TRINITY_DN29802_c0_g1_i3:99-857(-)